MRPRWDPLLVAYHRVQTRSVTVCVEVGSLGSGQESDAGVNKDVFSYQRNNIQRWQVGSLHPLSSCFKTGFLDQGNNLPKACDLKIFVGAGRIE